MIAFAIAAAAAYAFGIACNVYDINETLKVIDRGLALEANSWLIGPKPSHKALYLRDALMLAFIAAPTITLILMHAAAGAAQGSLVIPVIMGIKHIHGGLVNKGVLGGKMPPDPNSGPGRTAWWKFWHNW